ncbi:hypothetical protein Daesc_004930 [Daldinia eschscholtzii]|uniref:Uncharacterized protein n=1 Tax=Daldinia eschscholtzii TaxID=292717 RepID=A0AAX6MJ07_9PEZI
MSKLPPVEKLPLALRKNGLVRDDWENKKSDLEQKLSDTLTTPWTVDVNPNQLYAYATEGYAKESLGSCIAEYINGAIYRLKEFKDHAGENGLKELNTICHAHILTIDLDDANRFPYCGVDVHEGKLRILFAPGKLGANIDSALDRDVLLKALNEAPAPASENAPALSFAARSSISKDYEPKAEQIRAQIADILMKPDIKLSPNFEDTFAKLQKACEENKADFRSDWEGLLGEFTRLYWEGLANQLKYQKFNEDELLREGFHEAVEKGEIAFRIVDTLKYSSYSKTWGANIDDAAQGLVDRL